MNSPRERLPFERVLVTGGTGFVARHLIPELVKRLAPGGQVAIGAHSTEAARGSVVLDLEDPASVARAVAEERPDLIIHLAAQASVGLSASAAAETWRINLGGSLALAEATAQHVPDATFFFTSTAEVYGLTFNSGRVDEASCLQPQSSYARSKAAAEAMLVDVLPASVRLIIARASNHSGAGQSKAFVIPALAAQVAAAESAGQKSISVGNLDTQRDFLDVSDVIAAYLGLLGANRQLPMRSVFNVASGNSVSVRHIVERLLALSTQDIGVVVDAARVRPSEVPVARLDSRALRAAIPWEPAVSIETTVAAVLDHERQRVEFRQHPS